MSVRIIIETLGGMYATARLLDIKPSTVNSWVRRERIPSWWQQRIIDLGLGITPEHFLKRSKITNTLNQNYHTQYPA